MNPMEKFIEDLRELGEMTLESTMCDLCLEHMPDDQMNYDPQVRDGAPVCDDCYRKLTANSQ